MEPAAKIIACVSRTDLVSDALPRSFLLDFFLFLFGVLLRFCRLIIALPVFLTRVREEIESEWRREQRPRSRFH